MESLKISEIIRIASNISLLIPLAVYISRITYASRRVHIVGTIIIVAGLCDIVGFVLFSSQQSTVIVFNLYYALLFFLLTWFYYEVLFLNTRRIMVWIGLAVYLQSFILVTVYIQGFLEYQTLMWLITAIIMIIYSVAYFFYSLSTIPTTSYFGNSFIWINAGVMIYFTLSLFLFVMGDYIFSEMDKLLGSIVWSAHNVNNIIKNVLFAVGIFFYRKKIASF